MSRTVLFTPGSSRPGTPVTNGWAADRRELLAAAGSGDTQAVSQLCDHHGGALVRLARTILGDPKKAEDVVVDVIARACIDPSATATLQAGGLRRELARLTYLAATRCLGQTSCAGSGSAITAMAGLTEVARQQRSAIALVQCGNHTIGDVADLLGLSVPTVALLICAGLKDLQPANKHRAAG